MSTARPVPPTPATGTAIVSAGDPSVTELVAPAAVVEVSLDHPAADLVLGITRQGVAYRSALAVVRTGGRAVGTVVLLADHAGKVAAAQIAASLARFGTAPGLPAEPVPLPRMTVVLTTSGTPDAAVRAVGAMLRGDVAPDEIVVADTGRSSGVLRRMLADWYPGERIRLLTCPGAGRAAARNAGMAVAAGDVLVFADDGIIADRDWLRRLAEALVLSGADCATGMALPLEMDTQAHLDLERLTRVPRGYFRRSTHRLADADGNVLAVHPDALTGARRCLAVWREIAEQVGGFDPLLGAGTAARGGEDLDFVSRVLETGHTLVQEPAAILWHERRAGIRGLRREAFGRGAGYAATVAKRFWEGPHRSDVVRGIPDALRDLMAPARAARRGAAPGALEACQVAGVLFGPFAFAAGCLRGRGRVVAPPR
ncbi:MAG: glycosyltransferase [Thermoleophilia bacterium]|nr:glycosyltransferase [Thermoleophilia bacterium]